MPHNVNHLAKACISGCVERYHVDSGIDGFNMDPLGTSARNVAPWIKARVKGGGVEVTVGNESFSADPNKAIIKSIEFGFSGKMEGKMEIIDEKGGEMGFFLRTLQGMDKCVTRIGTGSILEFEIGWTGNDCEGNRIVKKSPKMRAVILGIESQVSNGLIRFIIVFGPSETVLQSYYIDKTWGTEEDPIKLEDAINQLGQYTEGGSPAITIKYAEKKANGEVEFVGGFDWVNHGKKGPLNAWKGNGENKYQTISQWIAPYRVKDGAKEKGVVLMHQPDEPDVLILLRDPSVEEEQQFNISKVIANFIVNGGSCSNVLEFNPKLNLVNVMARFKSGGSSGGSLKSNNEFSEDEKKPTPSKAGDDAGPKTQVVPSQPALYSEGPKNAQKEVNKSQEVHSRAEAVTIDGQAAGTTAELRIVGTTLPEFYALNSLGKSVSVTIINPFYIQGGQPGRSCGDWIKRADCNRFLSNKNWEIHGWSHAVQEGSFVTTLNLFLATPEMDGHTSGGNTLGANGSGISLENTC